MDARFIAALTLAISALAPCLIGSTNAADGQAKHTLPPWPIQLDMHAPFAPTAFSSDGRTHLIYELHLTNFSGGLLTLRQIDVDDADAKGAAPLVSFREKQLDPLLQPYGAGQLGDGGAQRAKMNRRQIEPGTTAIVFMEIEFDRNAHIPARLTHHLVLKDGFVDGAEVGTHGSELKTLSPPLQGSGWLASDGPGNSEGNHHRRGIFIVDGKAVISRRYAIDWMQVQGGKTFSGNPRDKRSYFAYGKSVLAVADGKVVGVLDGLPENVPGHNEDYHPAVPITVQNVIGNRIILDLGSGQYAYYCHLQPGSLRVKVGDAVRSGQVLAKVGDSGDAREPHLHFEITTSPKVLAGEGVPYELDHYSVETKASRTDHNSLPMNNMVVDFQ
jgi:Peptidase family M23